jgi:hypothetical protein
MPRSLSDALRSFTFITFTGTRTSVAGAPIATLSPSILANKIQLQNQVPRSFLHRICTFLIRNQGEMIQLFVKKGDGGTMAVRVLPERTVGSVKSLVRIPNHDHVYLSFAGRPLADDARLADCGVGGFATLGLGVGVGGGGGVGGATGAESRDCYLSMYAEKKNDKVDPNEIRLAKFSNCALTSEPLKPPCVVDLLGNIYNKEAVLHALVTKSMPKRLGYIKGLKDLIPVHLASIPGVNPDGENSGSKFQCPITGLEFNGRFKFVALRKCGHVLSSRALKEVSSASCAVCYTPFVEADKIPLNGSEEEVCDRPLPSFCCI